MLYCFNTSQHVSFIKYQSKPNHRRIGTAGLLSKQWTSIRHIQSLLVTPNAAYFTAYHYSDVIMSTMASQITSITIVYLTVYQWKHQSSASLAFMKGIRDINVSGGIHRWQMNSPHKGPVTQKMFPFDVTSSCVAVRRSLSTTYTAVGLGLLLYTAVCVVSFWSMVCNFISFDIVGLMLERL